MDFKIKQLNFLYLYIYCKECHIDASVYDDYNIEEISEEDIITLIKFIMFRKGIFISYDEHIFSDKIEHYLKQSDANNLAKLGTVLNNKVKTLLKFKQELIFLEKNVNDRFFIENFKQLSFKTKEIKLAIETLNKFEEKKINVSNNKEKNRNRILSLVFSRKE